MDNLKQNQINVRIDPDLIEAVKVRAALLKTTGYPSISVTDVVRTGLMEFLGGKPMSEIYGSKFAAAAAKHQEDEPC
jgi:hypothetical protein